MPDWTQWIILAAAVTTAIGVLFKLVFLPGYRAVGVIEEAVPVLRDLTATFKGNEHVFRILDEMASQFGTSSGSSTLREVVDQLEASAVKAVADSELLKVGVEAQKQLAERDRQAAERLTLMVDRLSVRVDRLITVTEGIGGEQAHVAEDLAAARQRADDTQSDEAGEAADAASQSAPADEEP